MKIILDLGEEHDETEIIIRCREITSQIQAILDLVKDDRIDFIVGKQDEMHHILKPDDIHYFFAEQEVIKAVTSSGIYEVRDKLYELETVLPSYFVRLSKSAIANLHEISKFEASFNGTLCVHFKSGRKEYASRHYVNGIKEKLKLNRREKK